MMTQADACAADHPDICAVSDIGTSAGGYRIAAVKISDNVGDHEDEPAVLFEGSVHGNEVVGAEVNVHMMNYLTDNFGLAPDVNFSYRRARNLLSLLDQPGRSVCVLAL
ncbi:MAG: M14 family zinc carboxypeptidase [Deltaproteobacteria bacterium]|nr:M14 family zinc carboxypeptidase [Deltaproteobacteria bacterium]